MSFLAGLDWNALVPALRPWLLGGAAAWLVHALLQAIPWPKPKPRRLADFAGVDDQRRKVNVGSENHKVRLAFTAYGLDVAGWEDAALWLARLGGGAGLAVAALAVGLPPLMALAAFGIAWVVVDSLVNSAWAKLVGELERETPVFLSRLSHVVQVTPNVLVAVSEVGETLSPQGPLRAWAGRFVARVQAEGQAGFDAMLAEAQALSASLGLAVFEIGRLRETGGEGYAQAFAQSAESLSAILQGRAAGNAKAEGVRGAIRIVLGCLLGVMVLMLRTPQFAPTLQQPLMQLLYAGLLGWVAYGWIFTNGMIEEALR